jgi:integrase
MFAKNGDETTREPNVRSPKNDPATSQEPNVRRKGRGDMKVETVAPADYAAILAELPEDDSGIRNRAIFGLCYGLGLRIGEARYMRTADLDMENGTVTVPPEGKGHKCRTLMFDTEGETAAALRAWLAVRSRFGGHTPSPYLFVTREGTPPTYQAISKVWLRCCDRSGVGRHRIHALRHTFASELAKAEVPLQVIQDLMGHENLQTTGIYLHPDEEQKRDATRGR